MSSVPVRAVSYICCSAVRSLRFDSGACFTKTKLGNGLAPEFWNIVVSSMMYKLGHEHSRIEFLHTPLHPQSRASFNIW